MQKRTLTGILATLTTLFGVGAGAQEDNSAREDKAGFLEEIVVTGSGRGNLTALQTSYGITILNADDVSRNNPVGLADLVDAVPGLQGEFANGETNTNLNVRGTNGGFNAFISLQEDGLPVQYSPFFAEFELRHDLSYERVEAVLGGPSGIFTAQGAAATINYISRRPLTTEGEVGLAVTDYGQLRTDFFYGGPIGDSDWSGASLRHFSAYCDNPSGPCKVNRVVGQACATGTVFTGSVSRGTPSYSGRGCGTPSSF